MSERCFRTASAEFRCLKKLGSLLGQVLDYDFKFLIRPDSSVVNNSAMFITHIDVGVIVDLKACLGRLHVNGFSTDEKMSRIPSHTIL